MIYNNTPAPGRGGIRGLRLEAIQRIKLLDDLGNDAGTDGTATLTDSETQTLLASDGSDQLDSHLNVIAGAAHLDAGRQLDDTGNVGGSEVELRTVAREEGLLRPPSFSVRTYTRPTNLV